MAFIDALSRRLNNYQRRKAGEYQSDFIDAVVLTPVTAALAAHGTTDDWENLRVIPLADSDEVHALYIIPPNVDLIFPIYLRWHLISNAASGGVTLTTTVDKIDMTMDFTGSATAGNGATALDTTIPAITDAEAAADIPFASDYGKINGIARGSEYQALFVKVIASSATSADRCRIVQLEIATRRSKFKGQFQ